MGRPRKKKLIEEEKLDYKKITRRDFTRYLSFIPCNWNDDIDKTCLYWKGKSRKFYDKKSGLTEVPMMTFNRKNYNTKRIILLICKKIDVGNIIIGNKCPGGSMCVNPKHLIYVNYNQ